MINEVDVEEWDDIRKEWVKIPRETDQKSDTVETKSEFPKPKSCLG